MVKGDYEQEEKYCERVNNICKNEDELLIKTVEGKEFKSRQLFVGADTIHFVSYELNQSITLPTKNIYTIQFPGTGTSVLEGFIFGSLGGGFIGNILTNPRQSDGIVKGLSVLAGIFVGGIIGICTALVRQPGTTIYLQK